MLLFRGGAVGTLGTFGIDGRLTWLAILGSRYKPGSKKSSSVTNCDDHASESETSDGQLSFVTQLADPKSVVSYGVFEYVGVGSAVSCVTLERILRGLQAKGSAL